MQCEMRGRSTSGEVALSGSSPLRTPGTCTGKCQGGRGGEGRGGECQGGEWEMEGGGG